MQHPPSFWSCGHVRLLLCFLAIFTVIEVPASSLGIRLWGKLCLPLSAGGEAPGVSRFSGGPPFPLENVGRRRLFSRLSNAQPRSTRGFAALGFQTLDLIKIFGRLADATTGNSALVSPYESASAAAGEIIAAEKDKTGVAVKNKAWSVEPWLELQQPSLLLRRPTGFKRRKEGEGQLQSWEHIFLSKTSSQETSQPALMQQWMGLTFEGFCEKIKELRFTWPTTRNTGQAPLNLRSVPACVFRCFLDGAGSGDLRLWREDVLRCIWSWAPADGTVDWEQFLFSLDETPSDNLQGAVD
ncbi:hypothetical protein ACSSS7_002023 [Eimeria intestinalis]